MSATLELVKQLREETDAPYGECVKALKDANDDLSKAKELLHERGKATTRTALPEQGRIVIVEKDGVMVLVGAKCETDFAANSEAMTKTLTRLGEALLAQQPGDPIGDAKAALQGSLRENIEMLPGYRREQGEGGTQHAYYLHHDGKRAAIVFYNGDDADAARKVAIQVVAMKPEKLSREHMNQEELKALIDAEIETALNAGKPAAVAAKIAEGKLASKLKEIVLLEMPMYDDAKQTVGAFVKSKGIEIVAYTNVAV